VSDAGVISITITNWGGITDTTNAIPVKVTLDVIDKATDQVINTGIAPANRIITIAIKKAA
jgi:hypothetical protein